MAKAIISIIFSILFYIPSALSEDIQNTSYSQIGEIEDSSWAIARRFSSRIVIPIGRSRKEVKITLERAAKNLMEETNADAVMVFAYRPNDPTNGMYSVGRAIYAPNGRWEDAAKNNPKKISVYINDLYFEVPDNNGKSGDTISLHNSTNKYVSISKKYESWQDIDIVARVPNGTKAIILKRKSEPMGNEEFIRYFIRTLGLSKKYEGWVHKHDSR